MALLEEFEKQGNWLFKHRGIIPLFILVIGIIIHIQTELHPEYFIIEDKPYEVYYNYFCLFISLIGFAIRIYTIGYTPKNTSGRNTKEQIADKLNVTGMYSIVRHPLYLGNFFMWLGPALLTLNLWFIVSFCLFYWIYYERIMFAEEQFLRRKFGDEYLEWANKVPSFIPSFKHFKKPDVPFNWKKILRNEKNGLVAIFIVFFMFDGIEKLVDKIYKINIFLLLMCSLTTILYFVLKYLKSKTHVLDI